MFHEYNLSNAEKEVKITTKSDFYYLELDEILYEIPITNNNQELGDSIIFGNRIDFDVVNDKLILDMTGFSGIAYSPASIYIEYSLKEGSFRPNIVKVINN